ncbi:helix-turn-helix domain-containing protein [Peribacillus muralis]
MDEKDCLILQYLLKDQNLTKAAERLYMTQPALTYRVRQIEKEFIWGLNN